MYWDDIVLNVTTLPRLHTCRHKDTPDCYEEPVQKRSRTLYCQKVGLSEGKGRAFLGTSLLTWNVKEHFF